MIKDKHGRSKSAVFADKRQDDIVLSGRLNLFLGWLFVLSIGVFVAHWRDVPSIYIISGIAAWVVFSIHQSLTAVLHELYELNDQIAGRKDEFRRLIDRHPNAH